MSTEDSTQIELSRVKNHYQDVPERGVSLRNVKKIFGEDTLVLKDITLDIKDKEFLILVGPSGCGKSTLLRIIAGLEFPTEGDIFINHTWINRIPPKDRNIAFVFQSYALYPHMNVFDNMSFSLRLKKMDKKLIREKVEKAAQVLNIDTQLNKKPAQLSGGQRQRVALGRAIVRDPEVFLLDEPLSNLDAKLRADMRAELVRLQRQLEVTMIYVTHDQVEAMTMGDRIVVLFNGEIQQIGSPSELYEHPDNKFVSEFIGTPTINMFEGKLKDNEIFLEIGVISLTPDQVSTIRTKSTSDKLFIGIRPEDVTMSPSSNVSETYSAKIDVLEPLGSITHVYLKTEGDSPVTTTVNGMFTAKRYEDVKLSFNRKMIHIFDGQTEKAILHGL